MATLKSIVTEYINLLDKPFDMAIYRRVRQLVLNQRAVEISKQAMRFGVNNTVIQYITPEFTKVKDDTSVALAETEELIITTNKVLRSAITISNESPFHYVGSTDMVLPFLYVNNKHTVCRLRNNKYFKRVPLYFIQDSCIVCVVKKGTRELTIGHAWHDDGKIDLMNNVIEAEYFDDEYEFLISPEMLQVVKEKLLKGELGVLRTDDKEVKVYEEAEVKK